MLPAIAQGQAAETTLPKTAAEAPPVLPVVDPAKELSGKVLLDSLRKGGFVLYMRHAQNSGVSQMPCTQNDLTPLGEEQAKTVGRALRELAIPLKRVLASELCRTQGTAKLVAGDSVEVTEDLNPVAPRADFDIGTARFKRLSETPAPGTNTLLVSHMHGGKKKTDWLHVELAEIIVFRPDGKGGSDPVARIRVANWAELQILR